MSKKPALKKKAEPEDLSQVVDPNVLLYLKAASRAVPHVEVALQKEAEERLKVVDEPSLVKKEEKIVKIVREYQKERDKFTDEIHELRRRKKELEAEIALEEADFAKEHAKRECDGEEMVAKLQAEVEHLRMRAKEAEEWARVVNRVRREIEKLEAKISGMQASQRLEIVALNDRYRNEEKQLREALVKKLRQTRDHLTAVADDDGVEDGDAKLSSTSGGLGTSATSIEAMFGGAQVASTKINEQLSREVSMYDRESRMVKEHNDQLAEQDATNRARLAEERAANEKLVMRNASHAKTKRVLEQKLQELVAQCDSALQQQTGSHKARVAALNETIEAQNRIIDDLNGELEVLLAEYDELRRTQKATQEEANDFFGQLTSVAKFAITLPTDPEDTKPQSGASGVAAVELLPNLGLNDRMSVATFIASLVSSV